MINLTIISQYGSKPPTRLACHPKRFWSPGRRWLSQFPVESTTVQTIQQRFAKCSQLSDQRRLAANMKVETDQHFLQVHSHVTVKGNETRFIPIVGNINWYEAGCENSWVYHGLSWVYHHSTEFFLSKLPESGGSPLSSTHYWNMEPEPGVVGTSSTAEHRSWSKTCTALEFQPPFPAFPMVFGTSFSENNHFKVSPAILKLTDITHIPVTMRDHGTQHEFWQSLSVSKMIS